MGISKINYGRDSVGLGEVYRDSSGKRVKKTSLSPVKKQDKNPPPKRKRRRSATISLSNPRRKARSKTIVSKRETPKKTYAQKLKSALKKKT